MFKLASLTMYKVADVDNVCLDKLYTTLRYKTWHSPVKSADGCVLENNAVYINS